MLDDDELDFLNLPPEGKEPSRHQLPAVHVSRYKGACKLCSRRFARGELIKLEGKDAVCVQCADLADLVLLRPGLAALTALCTRYSKRAYVVLEYNDSFAKWGRVGILAEAEAIQTAALHIQGKLDQQLSTRLCAQAVLFKGV